MTVNDMFENAKKNIEYSELFIFDRCKTAVDPNREQQPSRIDIYDVVTDASFLSQLTYHFNINFLLDIAHAKITAHNKSLSESKYFSTLPLDRTLQVHLSRHGSNGEKYFDAHDALQSDDWDFFWKLQMSIPNLRYTTIEYYKSFPILIEPLGYLKLEIERNSAGGVDAKI